MNYLIKRLLVPLVMVGCGGGRGNVAIDDLGTEIAVASCAKQFDCCTDAEIMEQYMGITIDGRPITTEADCVDFVNALFSTFGVGLYKESLASGRIEYDGDAAGDCIDAIDDLSCSEYNARSLDEPGGCRPFITPKVGDGGACTRDYECTSSNCVGAEIDPDGPDTDGMCQPLPAVGEACDDNCPDGAYCDYDQSAGADICKPTQSDGAECILDEECKSDNCDNTTNTCETPAAVCTGD